LLEGEGDDAMDDALLIWSYRLGYEADEFGGRAMWLGSQKAFFDERVAMKLAFAMGFETKWEIQALQNFASDI
jgi:hypothetical protein